MHKPGRGRPKRPAIFYHPTAATPKVVAIGQATETDTATVIRPKRAKAIGQVVEVDTVFPFKGLKQVSETDLAFQIRPRRNKKLAAIVSETDTVFAIKKLKRYNLGQTTETDSAFSVTPIKTFPGLPAGVHFYELELQDLFGNIVVASLEYHDLRYGFTLDGLPWAEFSIDMWHSQATVNNLKEGEREVRIKRDGVLVWGGYLWNAEVSTDTEMVRCSCEGWFSMFYHRVIDDDKIFEDHEQFDIAWNLINYSQNKTQGDLGITRGPETDSGELKTKKYRYWERQVIGDAINELSEMNNGFDYDIAPNKVFHMYFPRRGQLIGTNFELDVNASGLYQLRDARELASDVHGIGGGEGKATCIAVVANSTTRSTYKLREVAVDFGNTKHYNTMVKKATRYLNNHSAPTRQPQLALVVSPPDVGTYNVGDRATVIANAGYLQLNAVHRIIAMEVFLDQTGVEVVTVHFDERLAP